MINYEDDKKYDANKEEIEFWLKKDEWELYIAACLFSDVIPSPHLERLLTGRGETRLKYYKNFKGESFDPSTNEKGINYSLKDLYEKEIKVRNFLASLSVVKVNLNPNSKWVAPKEEFLEVIRYVTKEIPWFNWASTNKLVCFKPKVNLRVPKNCDLKSSNIRDLDTAKERVSKINKFSNTTQELDLTSYPLELKYAIEAWLAVSKIDEKMEAKS